ncbi:uncharacterized protein G2W53_026319 [Senna tora]|uniref:Uncharacterized protein n=1 Tax=Senna tora TaxID=362788 RepID=A0A834WL44_9FABA|nr:uncharacterized protein G2W53_026319 [Senna tora]
MVILCRIDLFVERIFFREIETSEDCVKVSTSEERQSFVENLDQVIYVYQIAFSSWLEVGWIGWRPCIFQAQIKNMQADKDIEKIAMVLRCPSLFVSKAL